MDIGAIISEYIALKPFSEDFIGRCPFYLSHQHLLVVIPQLKNYECLSCGLRGGAVDFIQRMMNTIYAKNGRSGGRRSERFMS